MALVALTVAHGGAQCSRAPDTAVVTLPGQLAVYYGEFRSLGAEDAAEFYGGVCVAAESGEWTVLAERVRVDGLSASLNLTAEAPVLYIDGWRVSGSSLRADTASLTVTDARVLAPDLRGEADELSYQIDDGRLDLRGVFLVAAELSVRGATAALIGERLTVQKVRVTTYVDEIEGPLAVVGSSAWADVGSRIVTVEDAALGVGAVAVPLAVELELSERAFESFEFPLAFRSVDGAASKPGTGLDVRWRDMPVSRRLLLTTGASGLSPGHEVLPVVLVRLVPDRVAHDGADGQDGAEAGASALFGVQSGGLFLDAGLSKAVAPNVDFELRVRSGAQPGADAVHEGRFGLSASETLEAAAAAFRATVGAELFVAGTSVTPRAGELAPDAVGGRLGAATTAVVTWKATRESTFGLTARAESTYYPYTWGRLVSEPGPALQWGVRVAPSWALVSGPFELRLSYDASFTNGGSPFKLDRLEPRQRATATARVRDRDWFGLWGGRAAGEAGVRVELDAFAVAGAPAGVRQLRVDGRLDHDAASWGSSVSAVADLAGLVPGAVKDDMKLTVGVRYWRAGWPVVTRLDGEPLRPERRLELGGTAEFELAAGAPSLRSLEVDAAVPFAFRNVELRPYVAVELEPLLRGSGVRLAGYGLDGTFVTCCGAFSVGARAHRDVWSFDFGVDLLRRAR